MLHRAQTKGLHSGLLFANVISAQLLQPNSFLSQPFCATWSSVCPLFLLSGGNQFSAILRPSGGSLRKMCPIHSYLRALIMLVVNDIPPLLIWSSILLTILYHSLSIWESNYYDKVTSDHIPFLIGTLNAWHCQHCNLQWEYECPKVHLGKPFVFMDIILLEWNSLLT